MRRRCNALFESVYSAKRCEFVCTRVEHLDSHHAGHATSRDLVPAHAEPIALPFIGAVFVWQESSLWLAYAVPPLDILTQAKTFDRAIASLKRLVRGERAFLRRALREGGCE